MTTIKVGTKVKFKKDLEPSDVSSDGLILWDGDMYERVEEGRIMTVDDIGDNNLLAVEENGYFWSTEWVYVVGDECDDN